MLTLGLIQMKVSADVSDNLRRADAWVKQVANEGAQVVVLPEMFACPYQTHLFRDYAEPEGGPIYKALSQMAKDHGVYLVGGSFPELDERGRIFNTCFVFDPLGKAIARHRKVHLFDIQIKGGQHFKESDVLSAGSDLCLFDTPYGRIGVMICFDIRFVEWSRLLADGGAELIVMPGAFNMTTGPKHWQMLMRVRAMDNQLYLAAVSPARDEAAGYIAYGHSLVADPWAEVLAELDENEGIIVQTIDFEKNRKVRAQLPILNARRTDRYRITEVKK